MILLHVKIFFFSWRRDNFAKTERRKTLWRCSQFATRWIYNYFSKSIGFHYNISCYFLGLQEVISHFQNYSEIPQIKDLALQVKGLQNEFGEQILSDFHKAFAAENAKHFSPNRQLAEACLVVSVLDPKVKRTLLKFILSRQLAEYSIGK